MADLNNATAVRYNSAATGLKMKFIKLKMVNNKNDKFTVSKSAENPFDVYSPGASNITSISLFSDSIGVVNPVVFNIFFAHSFKINLSGRFSDPEYTYFT